MALATKSQVAYFAREVLKSSREASREASVALPSPPQPQMITAPPSIEPIQQDFFAGNQNWLIDLIRDETGVPIPGEDVGAWLQRTEE